MKKFFVGLGWFLIFWIGAITIISVFSSVRPTAEILQTRDPQERREIAVSNSRKLGYKYGMSIFWASILIAVGGTIFEILPGTKNKAVS